MSLLIDFDEFLNLNPNRMAELITGKLVSLDRETYDLASTLYEKHFKAKREALALRGDTHQIMLFSEFITSIERLGFREIFSESYDTPYREDLIIPETYKLFWCDGLLAVAEGYEENGEEWLRYSSVHFNFETEGPVRFDNLRVQGVRLSEELVKASPPRYVWAGDIIGQEALAHTIATMKTMGRFLEKWEVGKKVFIFSCTEDFNTRKHSHQDVLTLYRASLSYKIPPDVLKAIEVVTEEEPYFFCGQTD